MYIVCMFVFVKIPPFLLLLLQLFNSFGLVKTLVGEFRSLRWLETVSSTYILMGRYSHPLSLVATIMVSKNCPTIGENVVTIFVTQ